jgi:hypothetical protein
MQQMNIVSMSELPEILRETEAQTFYRLLQSTVFSDRKDERPCLDAFSVANEAEHAAAREYVQSKDGYTTLVEFGDGSGLEHGINYRRALDRKTVKVRKFELVKGDGSGKVQN